MTWQSLRITTLTLASVLFLSSCVTPPRVYSNVDPAASFAGYSTYSFHPQLGTDRPKYTSLLSQYLKIAVEREMNSRGYKRVDEDPDLYVNFYVQTKEKIRSTSTPAYGGYGGYYGYRGYGTWGGYGGYETRITQYTEGTLTMDLVDVERDQLVWEGTIIDRIPGDQAENLRPRIEESIVLLFAEYPYTAGS